MSMEIDSLIFHRGSFRAIQEPAPRNSIRKFNELLSLKYQGGQKYTYIWHVCIFIHTDVTCICTRIQACILKHSLCKRLSFLGLNPSLTCLYFSLRKTFQIKHKTMLFNAIFPLSTWVGKQVNKNVNHVLFTGNHIFINTVPSIN